MKFRILGPLEIEESGRLLTPSGHTARALLTLVNRIDPQTNAITAHANLGRGNFIAAGHGAVWVAAR